jgi:hypothetical protein
MKIHLTVKQARIELRPEKRPICQTESDENCDWCWNPVERFHVVDTDWVCYECFRSQSHFDEALSFRTETIGQEINEE